jgi:membrane fusion protein (multidrug efflux system)
MATTAPHIRLQYIMLVAGLFLIAACGGKPEEAQTPPPPETDFVQLAPGLSSLETTYPGNIEGSVNVEIKAQVTGYLEAIYVKEGDYVRKGQQLFKIKSDVYAEQVNNAKAALQAALAAQTAARLEVEKIKPLVEGQVVSDMQLKTARANYDAVSAQVTQARAALGSSQLNAGFALITAPVNGYIGRIPNRIGNLVTPADATALTTLSDIDQVFVYFSMSEAAYMALSKAQTATDAGAADVELITADGETYTQKGRLEAGSGNIDRSTGSISMKAVFLNPAKLLRSGGAGRIVLRQSLANALTIPMGSVRDIQDKLFVFRLADSNKVSMTPLEVAGHNGNRYIVKSGLRAGDRVAVNRIDALNDGMVVKPSTVSADSLATN